MSNESLDVVVAELELLVLEGIVLVCPGVHRDHRDHRDYGDCGGNHYLSSSWIKSASDRITHPHTEPMVFFYFPSSYALRSILFKDNSLDIIVYSSLVPDGQCHLNSYHCVLAISSHRHLCGLDIVMAIHHILVVRVSWVRKTIRIQWATSPALPKVDYLLASHIRTKSSSTKMLVSSITRMVAPNTGCHVLPPTATALGSPISLISRIPRCWTPVVPRLSD